MEEIFKHTFLFMIYILTSFPNVSLQEQKAVLENEVLRKQVRTMNHLKLAFEIWKHSIFLLIFNLNCKQLEEIQNKTKTQFLEFSSLDRSFSKNSSKSLFNCASEENDHSDTSLQLAYVIMTPFLQNSITNFTNSLWMTLVVLLFSVAINCVGHNF